MRILKRRDQQRLSGGSIFKMHGPYHVRKAISVPSPAPASSKQGVLSVVRKIRVNPRNPRLKIAKVANTGCPIALLILQNKPNFRPFQLKIEDLPKKQTQNKPKTNPIQTQFLPTEALAKPGKPKLLKLVSIRVHSWFTSLRNPRNPRLNYYHFMQNEPNFVRRKRLTSAAMKRKYDNITILSGQKNEPKTKPNLGNL
jgi:hypothetical protein